MKKAKIFLIILILVISILLSEKVLGALAPVSNGKEERSYVLTTNNNIKKLLGVIHEFPTSFSSRRSLLLKTLEKLGIIKTKTVQIYHVLAPQRILKACECGEAPPPPPPPPPPEERDCYPNTQIPWGIKKVNGGSGGTGIKVGVLDTGIKQDHLDLERRIVGCVNFTPEPNCDDGMGHGTHVAGTIAADGGTDGKGIYGVAPQANLLAVKVCTSGGSCYGDDIAAGIHYAADQRVNIISMSLGGPTPDPQILIAVDYAVDKGVLVVAASGNDPSFMAYPGAYVKVMGIGAIDSSQQYAYFTGTGLNDGDYVIEEKEVELGAPGVAVESAFKDGCFKVWDGTSMATPHVSGLAAKLWQGSASATRSYLQSITEDIPPEGDDRKTGFGVPIAP